ncbi:MAG: GIY-YIG nuclease family protein [Thermodesulfobacteriota bacterium]|nr:GIY-YIG nuclease family protein [Thermodesulfobacteriota bacterium]
MKLESTFLTFDGDCVSDWWLYICQKKGHYYLGITTNVEKRLKQHGSPELLYKEGPYKKHADANREKQIKKWSRIKKEKLIQEGQES